MNLRTEFRTREGELISRSQLDPCFSKDYAIRKAILLGYESCVAIDSTNNRRLDYTNILRRKATKMFP